MLKATLLFLSAASLCAAVPPLFAEDVDVAIPRVEAAAKRRITVDDVLGIRRIDSLAVSPDGRHFALLLRQADPAQNRYRASWYIGNTETSALRYAGSAGEIVPSHTAVGFAAGEIEPITCQWSPDGKSIAYAVRKEGQVQLWRSDIASGAPIQISHNESDVHDFGWSDDGARIYFSVGTPREQLRSREEARRREGYRYDEDLYSFTNLMQSPLTQPPEKNLTDWSVSVLGDRERRADDSEVREFRRSEAASGHPGSKENPRADGRSVWLSRLSPDTSETRIYVGFAGTHSRSVACSDPRCAGPIKDVWWSDDGSAVQFWRSDGIGGAGQGLYSWTPTSGRVKTIALLPDDDLSECRKIDHDRLLCARETKTLPAHVALISLRSGTVTVLVDVNPEFRNIELGTVERFEWEIPKQAWNEEGGPLEGLYPRKAYGYILYPPEFDPNKKYPVFVDPYIAHGFEPSAGGEHALHVYAAQGMVVLNLAFPWPRDEAIERLGISKRLMRTLYSQELDFPHLTMLMHSTLAGIDAASARGFIDEHRLGMGGVSHGAFVPLFLAWRHGGLAALSISSPSWGPHEYYWPTRKQREVERMALDGGELWEVDPDDRSGKEFWMRVDPADHVSEIHAPILFNLADQETYGAVRLIRRLEDADRPYDAYVFRNENHIKWQPAHLKAILTRNVDWFRFWLQGKEDAAPEKMKQYELWRALRDAHS